MKSIFNTVKTIALVALGGWLVSCSTDLYQDPEVPEGGGGTTLPGGFDFSMVKSLTLKVNVNDEYSGLYDYFVQVFDVNPFTTKDAHALYTGVAKGGKAYTFEKISLSQTVEKLYIVQVDPRQGNTLKTITLDATSTQYECDFGLKQFAVNTKAVLRSDDDEYKTPNNATELTSSSVSSNSLNLQNEKNVIRQNVTISASKLNCAQEEVTLYVEGTLILYDLNPFNSKTDLTIVLQPGGEIVLASNTLNGVNSQNSELELVVNRGASLDWSAANVNNIDILNRGTLKIGVLSLNEKDCDLTNECNMEIGSLLIDGHQGNSDSDGIDVELEKNSILKCKTASCKNVEFDLEENAIFRVTGDIKFDKSVSIEGEGDGKGYAYCEFGSASQQSNGTKNEVELKHNLKVYIKENDSEIDFSIEEGASFVDESATPQIPAGECTGEGNETDQPDPSNPSYPIEIPVGAAYYTFAMEDNWPAIGDYDMNDLVLGIKDMKASANGDDQITNFSFTVELLATGATKRIGAGVQFEEIAANQISFVRTPDGLGSTLYFEKVTDIENNNDGKVVLPLFEDAHFLINPDQKYTMTNTYNSATKGLKKELIYEIQFSQPISKSAIDIKNLNFFIVMAGDAKNRTEVHVAGYSPTSRMTQKTNNYISADNMPYGIMVPYRFAYPTETKKVITAYPQFSDWALSAGKSNTDWYQHPAENMTFNLENLEISK